VIEEQVQRPGFAPRHGGERQSRLEASPEASLRVVEVQGGVCVCLLDDLDIAVIADLAAALDKVLRARFGLVVLDVSGCFVDLAGIRTLIAAADRAAGSGVTLTVVGLPSVWDRALPVVGLSGRLDRQRDIAAAVAAYHGRRDS
jgi:anti-anti-sigma regulatory factor